MAPSHAWHGLAWSIHPLAEDTGLILTLGNWVLETACTQLVPLGCHPTTQALTLSVNVSQRQFHQPDFVPYVIDLLRYTGANLQTALNWN